jgi:hypothetical protein
MNGFALYQWREMERRLKNRNWSGAWLRFRWFLKALYKYRAGPL